MSLTKIGRICVDDLNESAALAFAGGCYLSRRPSTPTFWFYALAIDGKAHTFTGEMEAALSDESKALLALLDVGEFESGMDIERTGLGMYYCTCIDDQLRFSGAGPVDDPCYACAFGAHDLCRFGCDRGGEIHFPERILDPRVKAAA